jgi:aerobic carbon-monoxide dehydrogenase medium subunit
MKPAAFDFIRVHSLAEASRNLKEAGGSARLVAGGQSLGPMLNLRLARPRLLIDITAIPELTQVSETDDAVTVGACITTANIEDGRIPSRGLEPLAAVAANIAYRAVRNRGTIGGSFCHADPAADWVTTLCAFGAECLIFGVEGKRRLRADQFILGAYQNALAPDEVLEAIRIPRLSPRGRWGYYKICRKIGEFALAIGAVLNDPDRNRFRAVIGATQARPILIVDSCELQSVNKAIDEATILRVLDRYGITNSLVRRQQMATLLRAYAQTKSR